MFSARPVRKKYGDYLCRQCMNRQYRVRLTPRDVRYRHTRVCPLCHASNHLVVGFKPTGLLKMITKW